MCGPSSATRRRNNQQKKGAGASNAEMRTLNTKLKAASLARLAADETSRKSQQRQAVAGYARPTSSLGKAMNVPGVVEMTYKALGQTDEGREYALVHLHPCGEYLADSAGIPDESQVMCVTPALRGDSVVTIDKAYFETQPDLPSDYRYDIQLAVLPFPEIDYIFRVRVPSLNTGWSKWVVRRTTYFSVRSDGTAVTLASSGYSSSRLVGRGITVHFDAPALADQGRLIAGQIKPPSAQHRQTPSGARSGEVIVHSYYLPQSETELTTQDPLCAQWEAKAGSYIPHRYVQPVQLFSNTKDGVTISAPNSDGNDRKLPATILRLVSDPQYVSSNEAGDQAVYHQNSPTWDSVDGFPAPSRADWGISDPLNHYTSVQFFLGIQNTAQLHVKTRLYLENEVHANNSPVTPFLHKSPSYDPAALRLIAYVAQNQAHVFFAADNDLGTILQNIGKILPGLLSSLAGSGIPGLTTVGSVGGGIGRGLKGFFSGF